jgi:phosphoglycolate phosphatase
MTTAPVRPIDQLPRTLILWDVDHTLIENGGVSKETYSLAFELLTGKSPDVRPATDGRTDFQIIRELFIANSVNFDQYADTSNIESVLIEAMDRNLPKLAERGYPLPGALNALMMLSGVSSIIQSVLTGNIKLNACAKLHAFDLDQLVDLDVGGYGSDNIVRARLVKAAQEKVSNKYGRLFDKESTILIGDTLRDVEAAQNGGAKIIGVATGVSSVGALEEAGANAVLDNLLDLNKFLTTLLEVRTSS